MLELHELEAGYGAVTALRGVSLQVREGEIVALLGANGAGKSTTLRVLSGLMHPRRGRVVFLGQEISRRGPEAIVRLGLSHVPEGRRVFPGLTVRDNLRLGASIRKDADGIAADQQRLCELFPDLARLADTLGWQLSGGQQQMLAIARGLMARPRLLVMDEPSLGLAPIVVQSVFHAITEINRTLGTTVLLVEQNASMALGIAKRGYVLENGRVVLEGEAKALLDDPEVREAYLGGGRAVGE